MNLLLISETSISLADFFFFFFFPYMYPRDDMVWFWPSHMIVIWLPHQEVESMLIRDVIVSKVKPKGGVLDVQSVCDPLSSCSEDVFSVRRTLPSASPSTDYGVTAQQLIKEWNKTSTLHRQSSEIRRWLIWGFFSPKKRRKMYLPPHWVIYTVNSTAYFGSSPQRLLFKHHQHFTFIPLTVGSVLGRGPYPPLV